MSKRLKDFIKSFFPGGLLLSADIYGIKETLAWVFRTAWAYKRTIFYLLRKKGVRATLNFLYVKIFVPVGEGAGGAFYFFASPILRRFPSLAPYPRNVEIEVTTICNKKCIICEHTYWKDQVERNLTFEEFKHIVDQFPQLKWTNLTGEGSAFLNKDYLKMIKYLKSKDIPVYLVDHFEGINEEIARELIEMGVNGIWISWGGATKETYEKVYAGCEFETVNRNIRNFIELKKEMKSPIPELVFRMIVNTLNVHEMPKFVEKVSSFGDRNALGDGSRAEFVGLLEFKEIMDLKVDQVPPELVAATIKAKKEHNVEVFICHTEPKMHPPLERCIAWVEPYIMMGGYVLPCCSVLMSNKREWLRQHSFGNLFETPFKDIWYSERYKKFRQMVNKGNEKVPLLCLDCRSYDTAERAKKYGVDMDL